MDNFDIALGRLKFKLPYTKEYWMENMPIEQYHRHTNYSNPVQKDCTTTVDDMMKACKSRGCKCMFTGEHGWQGSFLMIWDMCNQKQDFKTKDNGAKYPVGNMKFRYSVEAYWVKDRREKDGTNCHIILVARNMKGLEDINYILSLANEEDGFYRKARIDLELINMLDPRDVYITSSCVAGWKYDDAEQIWLDIHKKFGDSFFLEVQYHHTEKQYELNKRISKIAREHGIQLISGLDTHYLNDDEKIERLNYLARNGIRYEDEDGWFMDFPEGKTIYSRFLEQGALSDDEIIESMMNTSVFVDGCEDVVFDKGFKVPTIHKGKTHEEKCEILFDILNNKYSDEMYKTDEKYEGMLWELEEIKKCGMEDYFISNYAFIKKACEEYGGVLTTTSRGSAGSFISSKLLGFTTIDRYTSEIPMYSQRFLTSDRILSSHQAPDIDYNVAKQEPFVQATRDYLGYHGCYPLVAFGQLKEKAAWKMYADVKGVTPSMANEVSKHIDEYNDAKKYAETDEEKKRIKVEKYIPYEYIQMYKESTKYQGIVDSIKGHACGHLILNDDIRRKCGLIRCTSETTGNTILCTVLDGSLLDNFGYVKNDYLIVSVVDIIDKCWKSIGEEVPTVDELRELVANDEKTWDIYAKGATMCVNQCEKEKTKQKVMRYKPKNLEEVAAFVAAIRPGFKSLIDTFLDRQPYTNGEPIIDEMLSSSYNFMLYQESLMKIFGWLGVDMGETYDVIKSISKKKLKGEKLQKFENKLRKSWIKDVGNDDNFDNIFQVIKDCADYAFNSPHALSVGCDSAYIAYFKAHHTSKCYEVLLNYYMDKKEKDKVKALLNEAMTHFGYKMGSYQYGKDNSKFTVDDDEKIIYPNLASIKGIGDKVVVSLMDMYKAKYDSIIEVYIKIKGTAINKTHIRNLIRIGYFKQFGSPKKLLKICDILDTFFDKKQLDMAKLEDGGYDVEEIARFGRKTAKKIMDVDIYELVMYLINNVDEEEYGLIEKMINQHQVLGFIDEIDSSFKENVCLIQEIELNQWGTPFLHLYRICDGSVAKIKVDKKFFNERNPVDQYDLISIIQITENPKKRKDKVTNKWYETGEIETILQEYSIVKEISIKVK